jgi:hypothetical protein
MPALVAPPEKKKKKIRLRSRSNGIDGGDSNASAAQDQSPFPGIPLHTIHKMPDQPVGVEKPFIVEKYRSRDGDASSTSTEVTADVTSSSREQAAIRERSPVIEVDSTVCPSSPVLSVSDDALADDSGEYDSVDNRGRESGSEDGESPLVSSSRKGSDWKRKALAGRGLVPGLADDKGKEKEEEKEVEKRQNPVVKVLHEYLALPIPRPNHTATFFVHKGLQTLR